MRRRHAFMTFDAIAGLFLLAALATALAVGLNLRDKTTVRLISQRKANTVAQQALARLQAGGEASIADAPGSVSVQYLGTRVGSHEWVEITAISDGRRGSIVGLAPATRPASPASTEGTP